MPMLKMLAPRASRPPSAKSKHCSVRTAVITSTAPLGPRSTLASTPPTRWPEVPPAIGKFTIWAAKTKAAVTPSRGTFRGGSCVRAWRTAVATPTAARLVVTTSVLASRNPSGMCIALRLRASGSPPAALRGRRPAQVGDQLVVDVEQHASHRWPGEALRPACGLAAQGGAPGSVAEQGRDGGGERDVVPWRHQHPGDAVLDGRRETADARGDDGRAAGHGLEGGHAERLVVGGDEAEI